MLTREQLEKLAVPVDDDIFDEFKKRKNMQPDAVTTEPIPIAKKETVKLPPKIDIANVGNIEATAQGETPIGKKSLATSKQFVADRLKELEAEDNRLQEERMGKHGFLPQLISTAMTASNFGMVGPGEFIKPIKAISKIAETIPKTIKPTEKIAEEVVSKASKPLGIIAGEGEVSIPKVLKQKIVGQDPIINLKRDVSVKDVHGNKSVIPAGEALTPHLLDDGKVLLQDGKPYLVNKNTYANVKGNAVSGEIKEFAPEFKQTEEKILNDKFTPMIREDENVWVVYDANGRFVDVPKSVASNRQQAVEYAINHSGLKQHNAPLKTKYSEYTLPNGKNYREILIKAPTKEKLPSTKTDVLENIVFEGGEMYEGQFKSSHWDEPNVLAHLRMNDRVTPDGKKVTFMEELQSDWATEGRKKGFGLGLEVKKDEINNAWRIYDTKTNKPIDFMVGNERMSAVFDKNIADEALKNITPRGIPNHPLLKNWQELSLKRALKEAVDNNSDYLAWASGKQTADRYNLAKQVDHIKVFRNADGSFDMNVYAKGQSHGMAQISEKGIDSKRIEELIGKSPTEKIISDLKEVPIGKEGSTNLSGVDLEVGGEWASNLYDKQVPNILKKLTGKDAEVIKIQKPITRQDKVNAYHAGKEMPEDYGILSQQAIKITPEIRALVKGEPMPLKQPSGKAPTLGISSFNPIGKTDTKAKLAEYGRTLIGKEPLGIVAKEAPEIIEKVNPEEAIQKVTEALKQAKPLRAEQGRLYAEERAIRAAKVAAMGQKVKGQKGLYAQLGQMKGELPKVDFESIAPKLNQADIDSLFQKVEDTAIFSPFEKVNAKVGLEKLVGAKGGGVPTKGEIALLREVFPPEFVQSILDKRSMGAKIADIAGEVINLPRSLMATLDLSAPLRQGIFLVGRPKQWLPAFRDMFKYAGSEKAYQGSMEAIQARPSYKLMRESGLSLTDMSKGLNNREEMFMSNISEKIPVFGRLARGSNRAYSGFLNKLRADTFDDLVKNAKKLGVLEDRPDAINDIAKFVNSATGRGELGSLDKLAVAINGLFFSPRLMASRLNLLNPYYYAKLDPFARKEALKSLFTFAGVATSILGLAKMGGANIGTDPRSSDFGKIKIGNTRIDTLGGFQQYIVAANRLLTGQMVSSTTGKAFTLGEGYKPTTRADIIQRFFESKASPVAGFAMQMLKGKGFSGGTFDVPVEVVNRLTPMMVQDMYDLYKEGGLQATGLAIPGVFGMGSQTYGDLVPLESKTPKGKPTVKFEQRPGLAEDIVNKVRGVEVKPIAVKSTYDKVQELKAQGNVKEAEKLVNELSDKDYELYKKLRERDKRIETDEIKAKLTPVYKQIQILKEQGDIQQAQQIVDKMTDKEYRVYQLLKGTDYRKLL